MGKSSSLTPSACTAAPWPRWGWLGLALVAVAWPINWFWPGLRTHWAFFPLWLGYSLTVDALAYRRCGQSLFSRSPKRYGLLFIISAPAWWLFEALNLRTQNWHYLGRAYFSDVTYALWATLSFSTVMPAVFGTAQWVRTFAPFSHPLPGPTVRPTRRVLRGAFLAGWLMLGLLLAFPREGFPLLWLALYFILEPLNAWLGHRTLLAWTRRGDWQPIYTLWVGVLITAFFWEMWNYFSYPKWVYQVPYVGFWHVFEMPLLGYGGYLPFALELFALYHFVVGLLGFPRDTYLTTAIAATPPEAR